MCYVHEGIIMMEGGEVLGSCRCSFNWKEISEQDETFRLRGLFFFLIYTISSSVSSCCIGYMWPQLIIPSPSNTIMCIHHDIHHYLLYQTLWEINRMQSTFLNIQEPHVQLNTRFCFFLRKSLCVSATVQQEISSIECEQSIGPFSLKQTENDRFELKSND